MLQSRITVYVCMCSWCVIVFIYVFYEPTTCLIITSRRSVYVWVCAVCGLCLYAFYEPTTCLVITYAINLIAVIFSFLDVEFLRIFLISHVTCNVHTTTTSRKLVPGQNVSFLLFICAAGVCFGKCENLCSGCSASRLFFFNFFLRTYHIHITHTSHILTHIHAHARIHTIYPCIQ